MTVTDPTFSPRTTAPAGARDTTSRPASFLARAKLLFLLAAGLSLVFSIVLWFLVDREQGLFVGLWVPSILSLGALLLAGQREVAA